MSLRFPLLFLLLLLAWPTWGATTKYIRASATGTADGSSWANAYTNFPAEADQVEDATYYLAGGVYGAWNIKKDGISIVKATVATNGGDSGWNASYTNQAYLTNAYIYINANRVTIDGVTGGGPGQWTNNFGIKVASPHGEVNKAVVYVLEDGLADYTDVSVYHVEIEGDHGDGDYFGGDIGNHGFAAHYVCTNITLKWAYIHDTGMCLIWNHAHNARFEYIYGGVFESTPGAHASIAVSVATDSPTENAFYREGLVIANSIFTYVEGTGGWSINVDGGQMYGNVFYNAGSWNYCGDGSGMVGGKDAVIIIKNFKIYNNTFINTSYGSCSGDNDMEAIGNYFNTFYQAQNTNNVAYNNLFFGFTVPGVGNLSTNDYNYYVGLGHYDISVPSETHGQTATDTNGFFTSMETLDFTLLTNSTAGLSLDNTYTNIDPSGVTRSTWTRGAYEYVAATNAPASVTNSTVGRRAAAALVGF